MAPLALDVSFPWCVVQGQLLLGESRCAYRQSRGRERGHGAPKTKPGGGVAGEHDCCVGWRGLFTPSQVTSGLGVLAQQSPTTRAVYAQSWMFIL